MYAHEIYAYERHAYKSYALESHAHKRYPYGIHTDEMHACDTCPRGTLIRDMPLSPSSREEE
jgi:hypothetical protein